LPFGDWPNTDDIREAPALEVINYLLANGATVCAYDPEAMGNVRSIYGDRIVFAASPYDALANADALIVCTEWNEFRSADLERIGALMRERVLFDGRNLYDAINLSKMCFNYQSIGR